MDKIHTHLTRLCSFLKSRLEVRKTRNKQFHPDITLCNASLDWVHNNKMTNEGICISNILDKSYPEVTGYFIPTLLNYGQCDLALQWASWLISVQNSDGSWSDPFGQSSYTFDSGQILKGLLAVLPRLPEAEDTIHRGCEWILTQIKPDGQVTTPDMSSWGLPNGKQVNAGIHLYILEALRNAGVVFGKSRYTDAVERALSYYLRQPELTRFNTLAHFHAYILEALVDLGYRDVAAEGMVEIEQRQRKDGSIPAYPDVSWVCSTGIAQYAVIWYKLGQRKLAERALDYLCRIQNPSGGFYGSYGRGANYFSNEEISWAVKFFLDAYYWNIRTAFDTEVTFFPDTIEENDGRFQGVLKGLRDLSGLRVLDAGCGKGRFAKALLAKYPMADIWGVDISDAMLRYLPLEVKTKQGSLLNLPFDESCFDHVYCVEALEHTINPEAAIMELCRVVKPGGCVIIIDKNLQHKGALKIEAWEQWFQRSEVERLLGRYCSTIRSEFISYGTKSEPDGMFIMWQGTRKC